MWGQGLRGHVAGEVLAAPRNPLPSFCPVVWPTEPCLPPSPHQGAYLGFTDLSSIPGHLLGAAASRAGQELLFPRPRLPQWTILPAR